MYRRLPKRGFNQANHKMYAIINLDNLSRLGLEEVSPEKLLERGIIKNLFNGLKVLGRGQLSRSLVVRAHRFSVSAKASIEKAGGKAILIQPSAEGGVKVEK